MVAHDSCHSTSALCKIAGREQVSHQQSPSSRRVTVEVKDVDEDIRSNTKSGQVWYTISNASGTGKIRSGKRQGAFGTRHELILDSDDQLVFKLKHSRSMIQRNATVGSFSTTLRNLDQFVPLVNAEGQAVGTVHLVVSVCDEATPSLTLTACPWQKHSNTINREFCINGKNDRLSVRHYIGMDVFAVHHASNHIAARCQDSCWTIMESESKSMTLTSNNDCSNFELSSSGYSLVKGNQFESCDVEGTWTLSKGKDAVAVINVAGPSISCCSRTDAAMALAIGNAMYSSSIQHQRAWGAVVDRAVKLRALKSKFVQDGAEIVTGDKFFVFGGASCLETRLKAAGVGSNTWVVEHNYLRRNMLASSKPCASALTIASEMGWSDLPNIFG